MIDFIKIHALPVPTEKVMNNSLLTFPLSNVATTGEVLNRPQTAEYRGIKISVRPGGQVSMRGSLHKYHEGGTNYRDFSVNDIQSIVRELAKTFEFDPAKTVINFVEIGVNIPLLYSPSDLIRTAIMYRNSPFRQLRVDGKGFGKVCETQRFDIKIYDKSLQYNLHGHLLRYEVKVKRTEFLKQYGIGSLTLADLTRSDVYPTFLQMLVDTLSGILFYDPQIDPEAIEPQKDRELLLQGRYPDYWQNLPRTTKKRKLERFIELSEGDKIRAELTTKIKTKWNELTTFQLQPKIEKTEQINHLQNDPEKVKTEQINTKVNCYLVPVCPITGLSLSPQIKGSKYLTQSGINWYRTSEPETYQNKLETLLTGKWKNKHRGESIEIWVKEIAHQIRNQYYNPHNNPRNNTKRSYRHIENKGLKLFPLWETISPEKKKLIV
jgi:hypothetical protein